VVVAAVQSEVSSRPSLFIPDVS